MDRTIIVQLHPTTEQAALLKRTLDVHTACFNEVARVGFTTCCSNGTELHKETYYPLRRKLQKCGSKSTKRHLKQLSGKRFRQRKAHDHFLSKRIVQNTPQGSTLVLENLKDIRATSKIGHGKKNKNVQIKRRFHSWSFAQLHGFLS